MGAALAPGEGVRATILGLLLLNVAACSPAARGSVGGGIAIAGGVVTYAAIESMVFAPCSRSSEAPPDVAQLTGEATICEEYGDPVPANIGFPLAFGGLCAVVLGGFIAATAIEPEEPATHIPPAPPEKPTALDETDAVGMAIAHLVYAGVDGDGRSARLRDLDDSQVSLKVRDGRAELWNLRVHTVTDEDWRALGACYEYANGRGWRLTSLGTSPGCPR